jgi:hypothetical protein
MGVDGPAGAGKTYSGLRFAFALAARAPGGQGRVAVIDSEHASASKYAGDAPDGVPWTFDTLELSSFSPERYTEAIEEAGRQGYAALLIDSLSHAWIGKDGALELKDRQGGNSFMAWRNVTPLHNSMVEAILASPCDVVVTMRSKTEYVVEEEVDDKGRKRMVPRKVGLAPVQREGLSYEFDLYGSLDWNHTLTISKSRCPAVADAVVARPGPEFMAAVIAWLERGEAVPPPEMKKLISDEQFNRLNDMMLALKVSDAALNRELGRYGVASAHRLTAEQADEMEQKLRKALEARATKEAATAEAAKQQQQSNSTVTTKP